MTKALFDHGNHGTCPNLFGGHFMDYDPRFYEDEGFKSEPGAWVPLEEMAPSDIWNWASDQPEDESYADRFNPFDDSSRDKEVKGFDYINFTPGSTFVYGRDAYNTQRADDYFLLLDDTLHDEPESLSLIAKEEEQAVYHEVEWNLESKDEPRTPSFSGENRINHGALTWWDDSGKKDHNSSNGRRRNKGLRRAPSWQHVAGGRRKARSGQIVDTPKYQPSP
jgi:hypothetical protein